MIPIMRKCLVNNCFTLLILSTFHREYISEKTGTSSINMGPIIMKGIETILR